MGQEIFVGVDRRRRWSVERKLEILSELGVAGARVSDVARRHDISRQHIYAWRRELRQKGILSSEPTRLLPVQVGDKMTECNAAEGGSGAPPSVEIGLCNGRQLRVPADLSERTLVRLIRTVEAA